MAREEQRISPAEARAQLEEVIRHWLPTERANALAFANAITGPLEGRLVEMRRGLGGRVWPDYEVPPAMLGGSPTAVSLNRKEYTVFSLGFPTAGFQDLRPGAVADVVRGDIAHARKRAEAFRTRRRP